MGTLSAEAMGDAEHWFCLPVVMLINFALFQYLAVLYYRRRAEPRIALLLVCAFLGFAAIIPQAHPRDVMVGHLNDISETCSTLTFLIQITTIGRDIARKVRIWSLKLLTYVAELLTLVGLLVVLLNCVEVFAPQIDVSQFDGLDNIVEIVSLFFVFFFRFFYITMSRGAAWTIAHKKLEIFLYALFVTHELPFIFLTDATGISWEPVQAIWHRLTLMMCILMTIKEKLSSKRTKASKEAASTAAFSKGPTVGYVGEDDESENAGAGQKTKTRKPSLRTNPPKLFSAKVRPKSDATTTTTATSTSRMSLLVRSTLSSMRGVSLARSGGRSVQSGRGAQVVSIAPESQKPRDVMERRGHLCN